MNGNMKYAFVLLLCIAAVHAQTGGRPPKPPPLELEGQTGQGVPVTVPERETEGAPPKLKAPVKQSPIVTIPASAEPPTKPKLPYKGKGCAPGCGHTEICAELGVSYCRPSQSCSVCIKMKSIRLPASAVYGMYQPKPKVPQVTMPAQVIPSQAPTQTTDLFTGYYDSQPATNNLDIFGFPIQQQQQTTNSFNSMFPFFWMGDFGMGF